MNPDKPRLDYEGAINALNARGAKIACPICEGTRWGSAGALGNILVSLPAVTPHGEYVTGPDGVLGGINTFALTCKNCGFIRLHSEQVLSE